MKPAVIIRRNRFFCVDETILPTEANNNSTKGALYAAIHEEFKGAAFSERYKRLTVEQRMQSINDYAWKWLEARGFKYV